MKALDLLRLPRLSAPSAETRWLALALWILAGLAALLLVVRWQDAMQQPLNIFPAYYTAAKLIERGGDIAQFYEDKWFMQRVDEFAPGRLETYNANTPMLGFFFLPLAKLSYEDARRLTSVLAFTALMAAMVLMIRELKVSGVWRGAAVLAVFTAPTTLVNLGLAQVYPIVLLLFVLIWLSWRRARCAIGGAFLGIAIAFKTAGVFLVPLMFLERRWRALSAMVAVIAVLVALTFPFVGYGAWTAYLQDARNLSRGPGLAFPGYLSVTGFARNLFLYDGRLNRDPYFDAPLLATSIEVLALIGLLGLAIRTAAKATDRDITFALFMMISLILIPVTSNAHLCLGFLPAFIMFSRLKDRLISWMGATFLAGGYLSFGPSVERLRGLVDWGGPVFFYPRLLGLIMLVGVLIALGQQTASRPGTSRTGDEWEQDADHAKRIETVEADR